MHFLNKKTTSIGFSSELSQTETEIRNIPSVPQRFYVCITPESDLELNSSLVPAAITSKQAESAAPTAV